MNEREEFIQAYVGVFLACYAASRYDRNCMEGWPDRFAQPVEDAECLAREAWNQMKGIKEE